MMSFLRFGFLVAGTGRDRLGVAGPNLGLADQPNANIAAHVETSIGLDMDRSVIGLAGIGIVDLAAFPLVGLDGLEPEHEHKPAKRSVSPGWIGVPEVQRLRVWVVGVDAEPD